MAPEGSKDVLVGQPIAITVYFSNSMIQPIYSFGLHFPSLSVVIPFVPFALVLNKILKSVLSHSSSRLFTSLEEFGGCSLFHKLNLMILKIWYLCTYQPCISATRPFCIFISQGFDNRSIRLALGWFLLIIKFCYFFAEIITF